MNTRADLTELNRRAIAQFIEVRPVFTDPDEPDAHQVWIVVAHQSFRVGHALETKDDAAWYADNLCRALAKTFVTPPPQPAPAVTDPVRALPECIVAVVKWAAWGRSHDHTVAPPLTDDLLREALALVERER